MENDLNEKLHKACSALDFELIKETVENGADVNSLVYELTPITTVIDSLRWIGVDWDSSPTEEESQELYEANLLKVKSIILYLLQQGADINLYGSYGDFPLDKALWIESPEIAEFLLEQGADPNINSEPDENPYISSSVLGTYYDWFMCEDQTDKREAVVRLVEKAGGRLYKYGYNRITYSFTNRTLLKLSPSHRHLFLDSNNNECGTYASVKVEVKENEYIDVDLSHIPGLKEWHEEIIKDYFEMADSYTDEDWLDWQKRGFELAKEIKRLLPDNVDLYYCSCDKPIIGTCYDGSKYWKGYDNILIE